MIRKLGQEVHKRAADECFTPEQKALLEFIQGTRTITIEKQLNRKYGHKSILFWDEEKYLDAVADIVFNNAWRLEDIRNIKERIKVIKEPSAYFDTVLQASAGNDTGKTTRNDTTATDTNLKNLNLVTSSTTSETDQRTIARQARTETSCLHEDIERWDEKNKLNLSTKLEAKTLDIQGTLQQGFQSIEQILERPAEYTTNIKTIPFNDITYNTDHSGNLSTTIAGSKSGTETLNLSHTSGVSTINNELNRTSSTVATSYKQADANLKALETLIPDLINKFFNLFDKLYVPC